MKNLLLSSALLLTSAAAFAQLFVRPTPGGTPTDSYVYVKNEVLFVTNDINLQKNSTGDTEASIYLREGGQLLQGGTASTNVGTGFLSAQQTAPVSNAFAYNYWCSPVGNPEANAGSTSPGNRNFGLGSIYEDKNSTTGIGTKADPSVHIGGRNGYSSPLTISKRWITVMMDPSVEAYANYDRINDTDGALPGFGFTMKGVNLGTSGSNATTPHTQTYDFRGRPNNGDFPIPVMGPSSITNGPNPEPAVETAKMTLTGNPYPSALDLNKVFYGNTTLNAIYYYDEDRTIMSHLYAEKPYGYGVWVPGAQDPYTSGPPNMGITGFYTRASFFIWNHDGNHNGGTTDPGINVNNKRFAPIGQGFMFVGNGADGVPQTANIKNSHRIYMKEGAANLSVFQRPDGGADALSSSLENGADNTGNRTSASDAEILEADTRTPQLRLYVVFDNELSRDLLLVFSPQATDGFDRGFDGLSPMGMKSEAFFPIGPATNSRSYAIQGLNYEVSKMIPITFQLHKTSEISIRAVEEIRKPYEKAYLYDKVERTYRPLLRTSNAGGTFTLPAGNYDNRFYIVFRDADSPRPDVNTGLADAHAIVKADVGMFQNNPARQLEINNPESYTLKSAQVFDMSGKLVIYDNNLGDATKYSFYTGNLSDGVYLVKLTTSDDVIIDYKAMVMNK